MPKCACGEKPKDEVIDGVRKKCKAGFPHTIFSVSKSEKLKQELNVSLNMKRSEMEMYAICKRMFARFHNSQLLPFYG